MSAVSMVAATAVGALTAIVIARTLGPGGSGAYFIAQSLLLLLTAAANLGIANGIVYFVSSGSWGARSAYRTALKMALFLGLVGALVGLALRLAVPSAFAGLSLWLVAVVVIGLPFALAWNYTRAVALAKDRYEAYVLPPVAQATAALLLAIPGALLYGINGAVIGITASTVLVAIGTVVWAERALGRSRVEQPGLLRRSIAFGLKAYAANGLQLVNYRLDAFILAAVASAATVGQYSVAFTITSALWLLPSALGGVLFPRVAHLHAREGRGAAEQLEMVETKSVRHATIVSLGGAVIVALALLFLVVPIFGPEFQPAIELGLILLPGAIAIGIAVVLSSTIAGRGKPVYSLYSALVVTPVTVALYAWLIPWLDATGAAVASTTSYCLSFVMASAFYYRATGRRVDRLMVPSRSELDDFRTLPSAIIAWTRELRS